MKRCRECIVHVECRYADAMEQRRLTEGQVRKSPTEENGAATLPASLKPHADRGVETMGTRDGVPDR